MVMITPVGACTAAHLATPRAARRGGGVGPVRWPWLGATAPRIRRRAVRWRRTSPRNTDDDGQARTSPGCPCRSRSEPRRRTRARASLPADGVECRTLSLVHVLWLSWLLAAYHDCLLYRVSVTLTRHHPVTSVTSDGGHRRECQAKPGPHCATGDCQPQRRRRPTLTRRPLLSLACAAPSSHVCAIVTTSPSSRRRSSLLPAGRCRMPQGTKT